MIHESDILALQTRLERARTLFLADRLSEDIAWRLVRRTAELMERAENTSYEKTLDVIYTLVESLWSNRRQQGKLGLLKEQLGEL